MTVTPEGPDDIALGLSREEEQLRELEGRLAKFRPEADRVNRKQYATGVALVLSFGFVLAGCLVGGILLGDYLMAQTGVVAYRVGGILLGLVAAGFAGLKLLKPLL